MIKIVRRRNITLLKPDLEKPQVGGSIDKWGDILNRNIDKTDNFNNKLIDDLDAKNQELARLEREKLAIDDTSSVVEPIVVEFIDSKVKPSIDEYIDDVSKVDIDSYVSDKKDEMNLYVENTLNPKLDNYEEQKEVELNNYSVTVKEDMVSYSAEQVDIFKQKVAEEGVVQVEHIKDEGEKYLDLISDATLGLSPRVDSLESNKLDKGGYSGTAEDLKNLIYTEAITLSDNTPSQNTSEGSAGVSIEASRSDHSHPEQHDIQGNSATADKLRQARTISFIGEITGGADFDGSTNIEINASINNISADKIVGGTLDISVIPKVAIPEVVVVQDDDARFLLTKEEVQKGDTVKVISTNRLYLVIDDEKLNSEEGYLIYTADSASTVDWSGVTGKPSTFTPSEHNQSSSTITTMSGYIKHDIGGDIMDSDSLNTAIGKIEKNLDNKLSLDGKANSSVTSDTATKLATPVNINGIAFDGSSDITIADDTKLPLSGGTIEGELVVTGTILSNGNITAYSDERLKENVKNVDNALEKVCKLNGVYYNMIGNSVQQLGLIAQEVQKIIPEVVVENNNGLLSIDYSRIVALLIEAIKELKKDKEEI